MSDNFNFNIVTDSSCDMPAKMADELNLTVVPLSFTRTDGKTYTNYLDERDISLKDYYEYLRGKGNFATTSAPSIDLFIDAIEPILKDGKDVLYLGFSSGLSATYQSGVAAIAELAEKYPERKLISVDTLCACGGQGLLITLAAQQRANGKSIEEVAEYAKSLIPQICHVVTVESLEWLHRGGRVSATTKVVGGLLNIKPILRVDENGKLEKIGTAKGRKSSIATLKEKCAQGVINPETMMFINHADCEEDAISLKAMLEEELGAKNIVISNIGPVIGTHTGPGGFALFYVGNNK